MAAQAATARLALDASGFDKQANASFREFSKQLTSVKDATDVAMRGAEALQKVFVKSLGGTIAIGAASALGDAMRDIGNRIGSAADAAAQATAGMTGFSGSLEEAAGRAQSLASASTEVGKALNELANANPIQQGIFNLFGGGDVLKQLEDATKGLAGMELLTGLQQGNRNEQRLQAAGPDGQEAERQRMADEKARRDLQSSAAFRGADPATREKIMQAFEEKIALQEARRTDERSRKYDAETQKIKTDRLKKLADMQQQFTEQMLDRDLADARRAREGERDSAELLAEAQRKLAEITSAKAETEAKSKPASARTNLVQQFSSGGLEGSNDSKVVGMRNAIARAQRKTASRQARAAADEFYSGVRGAAAGHKYGRFDSTAFAEQQLMGEGDSGSPAASAPAPMSSFDEIEKKFGRPRSAPAPMSSFDEIEKRFGRPRDVMRQGAGSGAMGKTQAAATQTSGQGAGDVYKLLSDVLNKLTSAPMVSV